MLPFPHNSIKLNDSKTLKYIQTGNIPFFLNFSQRMDVNKYYSSIKNFTFQDIANLNVICRPGIFETSFENYINRRNFRKTESVISEITEFTKNSAGIVLYRQQLEQIIQAITKCSDEEAIYFRKKMGTRNKLAELKPDFIKRTREIEYTNKTPEELFEMILEYSVYAFDYNYAYAKSLQIYFHAYIRANFTDYNFDKIYFDKTESIDIKADFYSFRKEVIEKFGDFYFEQTDLFFERATAFAQKGLLHNAIIDANYAYNLSFYNPEEYHLLYLIGFLCEIHLELNKIKNARFYCDLGKGMLCPEDKDYEDDKKKFDEFDEIIRGEEWKEM